VPWKYDLWHFQVTPVLLEVPRANDISANWASESNRLSDATIRPSSMWLRQLTIWRFSTVISSCGNRCLSPCKVPVTAARFESGLERVAKPFLNYSVSSFMKIRSAFLAVLYATDGRTDGWSPKTTHWQCSLQRCKCITIYCANSEGMSFWTIIPITARIVSNYVPAGLFL
jgi:hypothetical protein